MEEKYIKYKTKYLELKNNNNLSGGGKKKNKILFLFFKDLCFYMFLLHIDMI